MAGTVPWRTSAYACEREIASFESVDDFLQARLEQGASPWLMARELQCGNAKTIRRLIRELP